MAHAAEARLPRATHVRDKAPAPVQITAEQVVREARELRDPRHRRARPLRIADAEELAEQRQMERKFFEHGVGRAGASASSWARYARWEERQGDPARARSVYERALAASASVARDRSLWVKYAEFEMRGRCVGHARNVWDRAVALLPHADQIWPKYIHMEETRFVAEHASADAFLQYATFEEERGEVERARRVYERATEVLADDEEDAVEMFVCFAEFEERCREVERARAIYKYALDRVPKGRAEELYSKYLALEKQFGDCRGIEDAFVAKLRLEREDDVRKNPLNYDSWFELIRLEESVGGKERVRDAYERAVAKVPPAEEKRFWHKYIYIWINCALYEELDAQDIERAREVYRECLNLIPHKRFTFGKIWLMAAQFEIRQRNLSAARRIFGNSIGVAPKHKVFKKYIEIMEIYLGNFDRVRTLYEKFIECYAANSYAWRKYAELEKKLGESDRARYVYELAIDQPTLDKPEVIWKEYLEFEIGENEFDRVRKLYERSLDRTKHLKVWLSYAEFEASAGACGEESKSRQMQRVQRCRGVFQRPFDHWFNWELSFGRLGDVSIVKMKVPIKVNRKRQVPSEDGSTFVCEEFINYIYSLRKLLRLRI